MDALNAPKLNLKYGGLNTPLLHYGYYKCTDGARVVHMIQTDGGVQKGLCMIIAEQGMWVPGMKKQQAIKVLFQQDYF